jgi:hypothetical protein
MEIERGDRGKKKKTVQKLTHMDYNEIHLICDIFRVDFSKGLIEDFKNKDM